MRKLLFPSLLLLFVGYSSCTSNPSSHAAVAADSVAANIRMYTHTWDEIMNHHRLDLFNDSNFTTNVVMHANPDIVGIDSARAYYSHYLTGFSDIVFTIKDVFGQGNKLVKHWNFSGTNTGIFFGMPPTGKKVSIDGVTLVRMQGG
jgi:uncharacterized protein